MVTKALNILNKFYNSKTDLFQVTTRSQVRIIIFMYPANYTVYNTAMDQINLMFHPIFKVLTTVESCRVHRHALANVMTLARLGKQKVSEEEADEMCRILVVFKE